MTNRDIIQAEAFQESIRHHRCGLDISMRVGKTKIGLMYLDHFFQNFIRIAVVAPKTAIFKSWKDDIATFHYERLASCITYVTYRSLTKLDPNQVDILVLDEFHSMLPSHLVFLKRYKGRILGLDGSPPDNEYSDKGKMMKYYCPIKYTYKTDEGVADGVLNNYRIWVHLLNLDPANTLKMTSKSGKTWYTSEVKSYAYWTEQVNDAQTPKAKNMAAVMRMKAMMGFPSKQVLTKKLIREISFKKLLIFTNTKEQADAITAVSYHSANKESASNLMLFSAGVFDIMACILQISEGITVNGLTTVLVQHSFGNNSKLAQRFGRGLGLDPNETSDLHVLCYADTQDVVWVNNALEYFDASKVTIIDKYLTKAA